ncbi:MAG: mismatch-specific DNA-glycosylase [Nitrospirae bacterium]|nr:mismatch-specific DNA-glycosylase [Nitrospirota bacterium]
MKPGVRLLLVGINPGLRSAAVGHHFAGHSNRFWKLLAESKLVPVPLSYREDHRLPEFGIGLTNIIGKPSRGIDSLTTAEYRTGRKRLLAKVKRFKPRMVALLGITIYRVLFHDEAGRPLRRIRPGLSTQTLGGVPIFVLPNPSGRNAHASYAKAPSKSPTGIRTRACDRLQWVHTSRCRWGWA